MFLFIQFIYQSLFLFCLLKLVLFSKFNSFLPNLLSGEHHKAIYPPYSRNCQVLQKKTGNKVAVLLFLITKRLCSLLITLVGITHYWLFKFLVEVLSMWIAVEKSILYILLKQQSIKSSTTKSCCKLYHYLQSTRNSAN